MANEIPYNENAAYAALMYVIYKMPNGDLHVAFRDTGGRQTVSVSEKMCSEHVMTWKKA